MLGTVVRVVAVIAALAVLAVTPVWAEAGGGYGVVPVWWVESGASRSLIWTGAIIDGLAVLALLVAAFLPRLMHR